MFSSSFLWKYHLLPASFKKKNIKKHDIQSLLSGLIMKKERELNENSTVLDVLEFIEENSVSGNGRQRLATQFRLALSARTSPHPGASQPFFFASPARPSPNP